MAVHACNLMTGEMEIRGHWRSLASLTDWQAPDPGRVPVSRTKVEPGQLVQHLRVLGALAHVWWFTIIHKHSSRTSNRHAHGTHTGRQAKHTHKVKLKKKKKRTKLDGSQGMIPRLTSGLHRPDQPVIPHVHACPRVINALIVRRLVQKCSFIVTIPNWKLWI